MYPERDPAPLSWPELPDESIVELHCLLNDFLMLFERNTSPRSTATSASDPAKT